MATSTKAALDLIKRVYDQIDPTGNASASLIQQLQAMSPADIKAYGADLISGKEILPITIPNLIESKFRVKMEVLLKVADQVGAVVYQRIWHVDKSTGIRFLTPKKYIVGYIATRRQIQTLENKVSIAEDNTKIDALTHQPTGASKKAGYSFPELLVSTGQGLDETTLELMHFRGGDLASMRMLEKQIIETGSGRMKTLEEFMRPVKSTTTVRIYLYGQHLDNNL